MTLSEQETAVPADLSALAWVVDELRRTLETAHKALRRQLRDLESALPDEPVDGAASVALQQARTQFHQGAGALEIVGQTEAARLLRASEQAVQRFAARPRTLDNAAATTVERASFALLDYLRRALGGKPVPAVALFPQYRDVQRLAGADRIHPADLWGGESSLPIERAGAVTGAAPLQPDATRGQVESTMLALLRGPVGPAATRMSNLFAGLAAGAQGRLAGLWGLAAAFFEAQAHGAIGADVYVKRLTSRLLAQLRLAERGQVDISDRLVQDLSFFCAQASAGAAPGAAMPRLAAVRRALALPALGAVDYEQETLGRYDPALIPQARRRVEQLKETWSSATSGQTGLGATLREQAGLVADAVRRLHPEGETLARSLESAIGQVADAPAAPAPMLAMEVATGLLCLDASLDDADLDEGQFGGRMAQLAARVDAAARGRSPGPIEPWMEELYRRASDRQTMGSVVQELRSSLAEIEQQLDKVNRNANERELLIPVPAKLSAMRGVLSVLGLDQAGQAVVRMRDEVDAVLAQGRGEEPQARALSEAAMSRLAGNVGALGFLIDLLGVQPQLAKSLFRFDAESGRLETVMGRVAPAAAPAAAPEAAPAEAQLIEQVQSLAQAAAAGDSGTSDAELMRHLEDLTQQAVASDQRVLAEAAASARTALARAGDSDDAAAVRQELAQAMTEFVAPAPEPEAAPVVPVSADATAEDDEMLDVFFEEAEEVFATAREALVTLADDPQHFEALTTVRRAFHTLKGSSRMVGLKDFGEAGWACEQLYNARLADTPVEADAPLREFTARALDQLSAWVQALSRRQPHDFTSAALVREATALREGTPLAAAPVAAPPAAPVAAPAASPAPDVAAPAPAAATPAAAAPAPTPTPAPAPAPSAATAPALLAPVSFGSTLASITRAAAPVAPPEAPAPAPAVVPPLPEAFHLDLDLPPRATEPAEHATEAEPSDDFTATAPGTLDELATSPAPDATVTLPPTQPLDFELDLSTLDHVPAAPVAESPETVPAALDEPLPDAIEAMDRPDASAMPDAIEAAEAPEVIDAIEAPDVIEAAQPPVADEPTHAHAAANDPEAAQAFPEPTLDATPTPMPAVAEAANDLPAVPDDADHYKVIGPLRIGIGLFNIFLNEADEQSRRLCTEMAEWALELPRPVGEEAVALAHSLAGSSATVGHADLSALARRLEHALEATNARTPATPADAQVYGEVAEEIRRLLHQFAAGFLQSPQASVLERLAAIEQRESADRADRVEAVETVESAWMPPVDLDAATSADPDTAAGADADAAEITHAVIDVPAPPAHEAPVVPEFDAQVASVAEGVVAPEPAPAEPAAVVVPAMSAAAPHAADTGLGAVRFSVLDEVATSGRPASDAAAIDADAAPRDGNEFTQDLDAEDAIDPELFEIFSEEAHELLPTLATHLRAWEEAPESNAEAFGAMRALHTLKGSARLAGAMRLGELAHRVETAFEDRVGGRAVSPPTMAMLHTGVDALSEEFERLQKRGAAQPAPAAATPAVPAAQAPAAPAPAAQAPVAAPAAPAAATPATAAPADTPVVAPAEPLPTLVAPTPATAPAAETAQAPAAPSIAPATPAASIATPAEPRQPATIDWSRFTGANAGPVVRTADAAQSNPAMATVRVKAPLLDRLVNQAGEVSITRSRLEADVVQMRGSLKELTENLERLRHQLRDIELQAETQIASRMEASRSAAEFDPLEMDRFTRFQEITRMMAESVNDVATVHRSLSQTVQSAEDEMAAQTRLTRALQEDLLRARMVPFDTLSDRLYRVVRQAAKETATQVRLNVEGSSIELDRSVLDRMAGAFEHLLRNAVVHGIQAPDARRAQGKDPVGTIDVGLTQQGNEVRIEIRDDGNGLDLDRIEARARKVGLLAPDAPRPGDAELAQFIFTPGFTTATEVTELAGRGVGMDVVRSDVTGLGGRIETASAPGRGTAFRLLLPLTTAVTRVVQLRCGNLVVAVPASLVEVVRRTPTADVERAYATGLLQDVSGELPFFWLGGLLQASQHGALVGKNTSIVIVRSAEQRVALHVDQVVGNQEVVVKNLGPQLARLPGLAGMSLLPSGEVVPIYNPVALASVYGQRPAPGAAEGTAPATPVVVQAAEEVLAPLVLVVDDSLTVRRVTQRLLQREGFRVTVAKDGLDALEKLPVERPVVMLTDIEMPRMDGFDLLRNVRGDKRWHDLPVIMITSRIAQKHRDLANELGADHYLGKPYDEEKLIALIQENVARLTTA